MASTTHLPQVLRELVSVVITLPRDVSPQANLRSTPTVEQTAFFLDAPLADSPAAKHHAERDDYTDQLIREEAHASI